MSFQDQTPHVELPATAEEIHEHSLVKERENGFVINCERCGCVSSLVRRDHDNIARCNDCYTNEFKQRI